MQEVYILPLKKPGLRHLSRLSKKLNIRSERKILNGVRVGGSPQIKGTLMLHYSAYTLYFRKAD